MLIKQTLHLTRYTKKYYVGKMYLFFPVSIYLAINSGKETKSLLKMANM